MPLERGGKEYLNESESADFLEVTRITFKNIAQRYDLKPYQFEGKRRQIFYLREDLLKIRDTPLSVQEAEK